MREQDELFAAHRSMVFAIAYEILGTRADAENVVQETYLRWADVDVSTVRDGRAYLARIATHTALNTVRTVTRRREEYPGPWLPEPLVANHESPEHQLLVKEQLSYALSVLLQQATPEQRAVFMLHDVFGLPYPVIAEAVGKTQAAVRQIAHRARTRLTATDHGAVTSKDSTEVLQAFLAAVVTGDLQALMDVLAPEAVLLSDGGGKVVAARKPIIGAEPIAAFLLKIARTPVPQMRVDIDTLNGGPGVLIHAGDRLELTMAVAVNDQRKITGVYLVRNPDKLLQPTDE
ncbi:RNA polymerase sigma factor SigJ [Kocuria sp. 2SI]|uniref:RNA polymerase sigma factor SigJ n=1 Tax=Kocuria sp. 2SI TaxID=2502203 RepID=UPI0010F55CDE|nr:RNA polymerase sigma factor SigJ [Kocuria sp. 2SI]